MDTMFGDFQSHLGPYNTFPVDLFNVVYNQFFIFLSTSSPTDIPTKIPCALLPSAITTTFPTHRDLLDLIVTTPGGLLLSSSYNNITAQVVLWSSSLT
jgi:hypothetical protein